MLYTQCPKTEEIFLKSHIKFRIFSFVDVINEMDLNFN